MSLSLYRAGVKDGIIYAFKMIETIAPGHPLVLHITKKEFEQLKKKLLKDKNETRRVR